jgi:hypothetical protein
MEQPQIFTERKYNLLYRRIFKNREKMFDLHIIAEWIYKETGSVALNLHQA